MMVTTIHGTYQVKGYEVKGMRGIQLQKPPKEKLVGVYTTGGGLVIMSEILNWDQLKSIK